MGNMMLWLAFWTHNQGRHMFDSWWRHFGITLTFHSPPSCKWVLGYKECLFMWNNRTVRPTDSCFVMPWNRGERAFGCICWGNLLTESLKSAFIGEFNIIFYLIFNAIILRYCNRLWICFGQLPLKLNYKNIRKKSQWWNNKVLAIECQIF